MKNVAIDIQTRTKAGKGVARKLRHAGQTPRGVIRAESRGHVFFCKQS